MEKELDFKKIENQLKHQKFSTQFYFHNKIQYASIPKIYLKDKNLSLKAKGLLTIIYALPEDWELNIKGIIKITGCGEKQINNTMKELIDKRYIHRYEERHKNGRIYYTYIIFTEPTMFNEWDFLEEEIVYE